MFACRIRSVALLFLLVWPGTAFAQTASPTFRISAEGVPSEALAAVEADLAWAESRIEDQLGPFTDTVSVRILADRVAFTDALRDAWGIPETACWMVGAADDHSLYLLSPAVWGTEACEHDPADEVHRRLLVAHEAVHVYHGQVNPSPDVGLLEDIGWFVEGLATYISGQLESAHAERAAEAIAAGEAPAQLDEAWSGPYRYGIAGSLVAYLDERWGRETLRAALELESADEFRELQRVDESEFLTDWRQWARTD